MPSENFPKLIRERQTGEAGVNAVSTIINDKLKWIFRRVNMEHDFGLDGYIDIVQNDGSVTGQSVAVQIKTGKSFFATETSTGFTFRGETKHLNYYLNLPVPILIVLYDEHAHRCYWGQFDVRRTEPTSNGWKINIPKNNILSGDSKEELLSIVGPAVEHTAAIKAHWALNETMKQFDFVHYAVDRKDVEHGVVDGVKSFIDRIQLNETLSCKFQGRIEISISGYDHDPRELFEIPEVVRWYQQADSIFKYWFFFASTVSPASGLLAYWSCLCSAKRTSDTAKSPRMIRVELDKEKLLHLLRLNFLRLNEMTERLGMSVEENKRISFAVCDVLEIPHGS